MNILRQSPTPPARCPRCGGREGFPRRAPLRGAYDVMSDSYGLLRCPNCGHRAGWAQFHKTEEQTRENQS